MISRELTPSNSRLQFGIVIPTSLSINAALKAHRTQTKKRPQSVRNPPSWQNLTPTVDQRPLLQTLAVCLASLCLFVPTGSAAFSQRYITALAAQRNHGNCLPKATRCFWLSRKLLMQSTQITHIEWNGVTRFAPRYNFPCFFATHFNSSLISRWTAAYIPKGLTLAAEQFRLSSNSSVVINS